MASLLEQHDAYEFGDGFSIGRRPDRDWFVYNGGKEVNAGRGDALVGYRNLIDALLAAAKEKKRFAREGRPQKSATVRETGDQRSHDSCRSPV